MQKNDSIYFFILNTKTLFHLYFIYLYLSPLNLFLQFKTLQNNIIYNLSYKSIYNQ